MRATTKLQTAESAKPIETAAQKAAREAAAEAERVANSEYAEIAAKPEALAPPYTMRVCKDLLAFLRAEFKAAFNELKAST
jgi:hypothetical protein